VKLENIIVSQRNTKECLYMDTINVRVDESDKRLLESYAKSNNKTISDVIRESIDDIIENEIHLKLYQEGMKEFEKDNTTYNHDEVLKELGIKKEEM
jgi:uncharacterized protein (DUF1778 family)